MVPESLHRCCPCRVQFLVSVPSPFTARLCRGAGTSGSPEGKLHWPPRAAALFSERAKSPKQIKKHEHDKSKQQRNSLCRARHKLFNAAFRIMPSGRSNPSDFRRITPFAAFPARHYQRLWRKAMSWSGGRYRPDCPLNDSVLASACSLSSRSACK